jgi:two-component system sensor histidine kinase MprB
MTFSRRLTLVSAAAVAMAIVVASVVVFLVVRDQLRDEVDGSLRDLAGEASVTSAPAPPPGRRSAPLPRLRGRRFALALPPPTLGTSPGFGQLVGADGSVVRPPGSAIALPVDDAARQVAAGERGELLEDVEVGGVHLRVLTTPAGPRQALMVGRSLEETDDALRHLTIVLVLVSLGGIGLGALLGRVVARAAVAPVSRLTEAAEHVTRTRDLGRRIDGSGSADELGRLAASFNAMLAELERAVDAQRQLVADASHELRTPLTSLRTNIEVLAHPNGLPGVDRRRLLADVVAQLDELATLVGNLVDLARDEEPGPTDESLRLDLLATDAVERARRRAPDRSFSTEFEPCVVRGVRERLDRALDNLLDNAAKWSPEDGEVEVTVTSDGEVCVCDHGPGIDPVDAPRVFDRFYRSAGARGTAGSGLGLAIVRQVAEAHGGSVEAEAAPGGGALLRISLPAMSLANSSAALS